MSAMSGCLKLAKDILPSDSERLLAAVDSYIAAGIAPKDAQRNAVQDMLAELELDAKQARNAVREQHPDLFPDDTETESKAHEPVYFSDPAQWSRREFNRSDLGSYIGARNKTLNKVNADSVLEGDIDRAAKAIELVRDAIAAGSADQTEVPIGPMPHVLHMLGAPMQMLQVHASIIKKVLLDKHAGDFEGITPRQLVEAIYQPAMVIQSAKGEFELVSQITNPAGQPIMFALKANTELADGTKMASLMSAYAKDQLFKPGAMQALLAARQVKYVNLDAVQALEEKSPAVARGLGRADSAPANGDPASSGNKAGSHFPGTEHTADFLGRDRPGINLGARLVTGVGSDRLGPTSASSFAKAAAQAINRQSIKGFGDLVNFIGQEYRGGPDDMPAFSRREGKYSLSKFGIGAQVVEAIQDRYNRLKQAIEQVRKQGGTVTEANDFYATEERFWGKVATRNDDFHDEIKTFIKAVAKDRLMLDDVGLYAYALHAKERNEWIAANRPGMPDGGSGMTNAEADAILAEAAASGLEPELAKHAATIRQWTQGTRDILLNEGLINQETYDAWTNMFKAYVPLRGLEGAPEKQGTGRGFDIRGQEGKRALGRKSEAKQIIEQIIQDRTRALIRAGKNEVGRAFGQFVLDNPSPNLWEVSSVENKAVESIDENGNRVIEEKQQIIKDDRAVTYKDGGKEVHIAVFDEPLRRQLQNMHVENVGRVVGSLLWVNRKLGQLYTSLNPVFTVLNGARDLGAATIGMIDEIGFMAAPKLWAKMPQSLYEAYRAEAGSYSRDYELYRATGGKTGFFDFKTLDAQTKELHSMLEDAERLAIDPRKFVPKIMHFIEAMNGGIENATRLASFKVARESGLSVVESARLSKNITVNFNRKGTLTPALSAWFLFFNPAVQGSARIIQSLSHPKVQATLGMGMLGVLALALRNAGMGDDDDGVAWWDKIPDEVKERNLIIVLPPGVSGGNEVPGSKTGRYLKVPMPYGYNFFAVVANQIADTWRHSQDPKRGRDGMRGMVKAFNAFAGAWIPVQELGKSFDNPKTALLAAVPDALNPIAQNLANSNSFGRQVYPEDAQTKNVPNSSKVFPGQAFTLFDKAAQGLNKATGGSKYESGILDISPGSLENLARGYGGGPVGFTLDLLNALYVRQTIDRPTMRTSALPFVKQLYGEIDTETDKLTGYDRLTQAEKVVDPFHRAVREGAREDVQKMRQENGEILRLGDVIKTTREQLALVRKKELAILARDGVSDGDKYVQLMAEAARRRAILQRFNALYDRAIESQAAAKKPPEH